MGPAERGELHAAIVRYERLVPRTTREVMHSLCILREMIEQNRQTIATTDHGRPTISENVAPDERREIGLATMVKSERG